MSGSQSTQDVVAVFDNAFNQIFINARPTKADVKETAKVMKHPVESGSTITDHKIIQPISIDLHFTLIAADLIDTYREIKSIFTGNATIQVMTNTGLYSSMVIEAMPHTEDTDRFDTIVITMKLTQFEIVTAKTTATSTVATGNKSGKAATATEQSNANEKAQNSSAAYSLLYGKGKE